MDTFAHAAWTYIIFHATGSPWLAVFFGVMPDLFSWTIYMFYAMVRGELRGKPEVSRVPEWVFTLYGLTHSVFVFAGVVAVLFLTLGYVPVYIWAWAIHILIDIPTHSRKFLPTPFLWPFSEWKFSGFSWGQKWFMIMNWSAIIIIYLVIFL